jgi:hypothetical protein
MPPEEGIFCFCMPFQALEIKARVLTRSISRVRVFERNECMNMSLHRDTRHRNVTDWLLLANLALAFNNIGLIWLIQISVYPLWFLVPPAAWPAYHWAWFVSIWSVIFIPATISFVLTVLTLWWRPAGVPRWAIWLVVGLQAIEHLLTLLFWAPLQAKIGPPHFTSELNLLLTTHWLRVALVTAHGFLILWMAVRHWRVGMAKKEAPVSASAPSQEAAWS